MPRRSDRLTSLSRALILLRLLFLRLHHGRRLPDWLRLVVDEVIHDRDIRVGPIVRTEPDRAVSDPHARDDRPLEDNAEEGIAAIVRRHGIAAERLVFGVEEFERRVALVDVDIDRAETAYDGPGCGA